MTNSIIFTDGARSGSFTRNLNIQLLESAGFTEGGQPCRSGEMQIVHLKSGEVRITFGIKANITGPNGKTKYFSLDRVFQNKQEARNVLENIGLVHVPHVGSPVKF